MNVRNRLGSIWVRLAVFLWGIVFPIVFVALPLADVLTGEGELTAGPFWALAVWFLGPAAVAIGMKYFGGTERAASDR